MTRLILMLFTSFVLFGMLTIESADGQVDPEVGRKLSQRLVSDEQQFHIIRDRYKALIKQGFYGVYDSVVVQRNFEDCVSMFELAGTQITDFDFKWADQHLSHAEAVMQATQKILDEDASTTIAELKKDSILNEYPSYLSSNEDFLKLRGPALRAAIASEIQFAERVIRKAHVGNLGDVYYHENAPSTRTVCSDAKDQFILREADVAHGFGYLSWVQGSPGGAQLTVANIELRLLHYSTAHELARKALDIGSTDSLRLPRIVQVGESLIQFRLAPPPNAVAWFGQG